MLPKGFSRNTYSSVAVDDTKESYKMVDYLCKNGHKDIAILCARKTDASIGKLRLEGYKKALKDNGKKVQLNTVQEAIKNHLAYVTEDRKGNGLILSNPIKINTTLANLDAISRHTVIDKDKEYNVAVDYKNKLNTKCPTVEQNVGNLSGGNQQKVLLAKWMFTDPDILILDEPTRGIDVGAKYEIYCIINQLVAEGKSVIMISSELPEILGMCDRIYVMNEGKIVGELAGSEATQELIMSKILSAGKKGALA